MLKLILFAVMCAVPPKASEAPVGADLTWRGSGPGGGGWIESIAWDRREPGTLHVGCDVGGFYVSRDRGHSYEIRNGGLRDYFIESIAQHPTDPRILLVGTESGIHRSADGGRSWMWIRAGFPPTNDSAFSAPISCVTFDPGRPSVAYAGIGRPRFGKSGAGAIYRSDDAGLSWRLASGGALPSDAIIGSLAFRPGHGRTTLAATNRGVFRTDDDGKTWRVSQAGLPHEQVRRVAFAVSDPSIAYATLETTARDAQPFNGGVFRSEDGGHSWKAANGPGLPERVGKASEPMPMTSNLDALVIDPRSADVVYVGDHAWVTAGVYKTIDGGRHWARTTISGPPGGNMDYGWLRNFGPTVESLALSPADPDCLAFGTSGHVFVSQDAGRTWQQRYCRLLDDGRFAGNGLEVTCLNGVSCDPVRPGRVYYNDFDIGLLISDDGGGSFRRSSEGMTSPGNCFTVVVDPESPGTMWAGTGWWEHNAGDVCRSDDGGRTWQVVGHPKSGLPDGQTHHLLLDGKSPLAARRLVVTSKEHGVFESRDGGRTWSGRNGDLPPEALKAPAGLLLDPEDSSRMTLALSGPPAVAGIYGTLDAGRSWRRLHEEDCFASIECLAADPGDARTLYVGARRSYDASARRVHPGGLFKSGDGGRTWSQVLDAPFVKAVAVSPADPRVVYVGTTDHPYHDDSVSTGFLKSADGGLHWRVEDAGLSHHNISSITVDPHDPSRIYVGTAGNGVFIGRDRGVVGKGGGRPTTAR